MGYSFYCSKCDADYRGGFDDVRCPRCDSYCGHMRSEDY